MTSELFMLLRAPSGQYHSELFQHNVRTEWMGLDPDTDPARYW